MNAPGKGLLKTVSILFIIFGAIATLITLIGTLVVGAAASLASGLGEAGGAVVSALAGIAVIILILALLVSVLELIIGIIGVANKRCNDPSKAGFYIATGIVLCVLALISLILSISNDSSWWTSGIGFVLPILYIVGGFMNKKAVAAPPYQPPMQ